MPPELVLMQRAEHIDPAEFRRVARHLAATVNVIATGRGGGRRGLTATSVCSLSDAPPSLIACIHKKTETHAALVAFGRFTVNVAALGQEGVADRFAGRHGVRGAERFSAHEWRTLPTGSPALAGAAAVFDCRLDRCLDGGTHTILVGVIEDAFVDDAAAPLLYHRGAFSALAG